jgi:Tol biopolymer transport system component
MKAIRNVLLLLFFSSFFAEAQKIEIVETKSIKPGETGNYTIAGVVPNGKYLLLTKQHLTGLYLLDLKTSRVHKITELQGAGYKPVSTKSGSYVLYRTDDYSEKKKLSSIHKIKVSTGDSTLLVSNKRTVSTPIVIGNNIVYTVDGKLKRDQFHWWMFTNPADKTFVLNEDLLPVLWEQGEERVFIPGGEGSYIWISLSPDKKKMLYHLAGQGTFVCDLSGNFLLSAGNLLNPCWLNNNYIAGIGTHDMSDKSIATDIIAYSLKTKERIIITNTEKVNERNPFPFARGRKIAYQTSTGDLEVIKIRIK